MSRRPRRTFDKWVKQHNQSGSFKEKDNRTPQEQELLDLKKKNQQLMMENDILSPPCFAVHSR